MTLQIFVTGGTIDKQYDLIQGQLKFNETQLPRMLELVRCQVDCQIERIAMMDSLEMVDADRQAILERCRQSPHERIVITHGTDTMCETAAVLGRARLASTIVLVGAMIPFSFGQSDALFNLGSAMVAAQLLPAGTWIAMNGKVFPWDNVRKNRELGIFEALPS